MTYGNRNEEWAVTFNFMIMYYLNFLQQICDLTVTFKCKTIMRFVN